MEPDKLAVMINCSTTGKPVMTGISMNSLLFRNATIEGREVLCPHWRAALNCLEGSSTEFPCISINALFGHYQNA